MNNFNETDVNHQGILFLLGGQDLEMQCIECILTDFGFIEFNNSEKTISNNFYLNKNLNWSNAKIDSYQEFLSFPGIIYGIELRESEDFIKPENYYRIDHHSDFTSNPSSLQQVIKILTGIEPENLEYQIKNTVLINENSRTAKIAKSLGVEVYDYINMVIVNDTEHIQGLRRICKNEKIIKEIRFADRTAQGVTPEDWISGEKSLEAAGGKIKIKDVVVVKSLCSHFSVITDRIDEPKLIVYDENELVYFGLNAHSLKDVFTSETKNKTAYYGGSKDQGFFGFAKGVIKRDNKEEIINKIVNTIANQAPASHHIFLFPFQWDYNSGYQKDLFNQTFEDRTSLKKIEELMNGLISNENISSQTPYEKRWRKFLFSVKKPSDFNEYSYFYNHVREALFDNIRTESDRKTVLQYEYQLPCETKYVINIRKRDKHPAITYELDIENIAVNFYDTGVGIFSFHLTNNNYFDADDILHINDFGRRIYPQYLSIEDSENCLYSAQGSFLAESIQLKSEKTNFYICECFKHYKNPEEIGKCKLKLPAHIGTLLGSNFSTDTELIKKDMVRIRPVIDDRMFTMCWYGDTKTANELKIKTYSESKDRTCYGYEDSSIWNKFIFVDNADSGQNSDNLLKKLNIEHTYDRWIEKGTIFGISRYSFIVLTNADWFGKNIIQKHLQTMYFQLVMLALVQRASVLRFSIEVTSLSQLDEKTRISKNIQNLHKKYIRFVNKIYFREVTAQEQGIELYDMLVSKMRLASEVKELDSEIEELYRYSNNIETSESNKKLTLLSVIAALFIIPTLIVGFYGMNIFDNKNTCITINSNSVYYLILGFVAALISGIAVYIVNKEYFKKKKIVQSIIVFLAAIIIICILLLPIICNN